MIIIIKFFPSSSFVRVNLYYSVFLVHLFTRGCSLYIVCCCCHDLLLYQHLTTPLCYLQNRVYLVEIDYYLSLHKAIVIDARDLFSPSRVAWLSGQSIYFDRVATSTRVRDRRPHNAAAIHPYWHGTFGL